MWRYERPQKGRFRQFTQAGIEILGHEEGNSEYEMLSLICNIIDKLSINNSIIKINHLGDPDTKKAYCDSLVTYLSSYKNELNETELERLDKNPLKILDSKVKKLKKYLKTHHPLKIFYQKKILIYSIP